MRIEGSIHLARYDGEYYKSFLVAWHHPKSIGSFGSDERYNEIPEEAGVVVAGIILRGKKQAREVFALSYIGH